MTNQRNRDRTPFIAGVGTALPGPRHSQEAIQSALEEFWGEIDYDSGWVDHFFDSVGVDSRHLALPFEAYFSIDGFTDSNRHWIEKATELGAGALVNACENGGLAPDRLDAIFFTTVTGVASPSIDAAIINEVGLDRGIDRVPMFGLGCVGGAAGLGRVADYLRGHPDRTAAIVAVELCSLTVERNDPAIADMIAAALFGDGAACAVCAGGGRRELSSPDRPRMTHNGGVFYHDTEWVMGWEVGSQGFELVLSGDLPKVIERELGDDLEGFLADSRYELGDVERWICHPGGPKVLEAIGEALDLEDDALASARESLRSVGNMSSASVLKVLEDEMRNSGRAEWSGPAILMAMGPGFSAEFVLLE